MTLLYTSDPERGRIWREIFAAEAPGKCQECDRPLAKKRPRCIYCGTETPPGLFER